MSDDAAEHRKALAAEAQRLKEQREQQQALAAESSELEQRKKRVEAQSFSTSRLRRSLSAPWKVWVAGGLLVASVMTLTVPEEDHEGPVDHTQPARVIPATLFGLAGLWLLPWHFTAVMRAEGWRKRLPFAVEGFDEVLGGGVSVREACVDLHFSDTRADPAVLGELVRARMNETTVFPFGDLIRVEVKELSWEGGNWPVAGWFRKLVNSVILDVHKGYPLKRIVLRATKTEEFYVPSGD